jgi:1-hydroxycarotenoid 3,4-desaturase
VRVTLRPDRIAIIGSGVGALSAAVALAVRGCDVTVFERASCPGGKLRELTVAGRAIDSGPTVLTMRWVFDEIFADAGSTLDAHLVLEPLEVLARHYWGQHEPLDLFADEARTTDAIGRFAGAVEARGYERFCTRARNIFETLDGPFMRAAEPSMLKLITGVGFKRPTALLGIEPFATLWNALGSYFKDARLQQLFGRYATYCGASPFQAPATLMLIAHVERMGVWSVKGGMHQIAEALSALAIRNGAVFRYNTHVQRILTDKGRASGVEVAGDRSGYCTFRRRRVGAWHGPVGAVCRSRCRGDTNKGQITVSTHNFRDGQPRRLSTAAAHGVFLAGLRGGVP